MKLVESRAGAPPRAQRSEQEIEAVGAEENDPGGDGRLLEAQEQTAVEVTQSGALESAESSRTRIKNEDGHQDKPHQQACRGGHQFSGPGAVFGKSLELESHDQL